MPQDLNYWQKQAEQCSKKCSLRKKGNKCVFAKGNQKAKIMLIGEAPGENEAIEGKPFVGKAGKNLDKCLIGAGLNPDDLYITNIVKCRPDNNRNPKANEIKNCMDYLIGQIEAVNPKVIILCGAIARKAFGIKKPLKDCHGELIKKTAKN